MYPRNWRLNGDYKIFTRIHARILTQRMNHAVVQFVSDDQNGFVPHAFIAENLLRLQMIQAYMDEEDEEGLFVFLDMEKAFDRCSWEFILEGLDAVGFDNGFVDYIRTPQPESLRTTRTRQMAKHSTRPSSLERSSCNDAYTPDGETLHSAVFARKVELHDLLGSVDEAGVLHKRTLERTLRERSPGAPRAYEVEVVQGVGQRCRLRLGLLPFQMFFEEEGGNTINPAPCVPTERLPFPPDARGVHALFSPAVLALKTTNLTLRVRTYHIR